jgi:alanine dehydrogenase
MKVGCVKEIKNNEFRVGMTPDNAKEYALHGHRVFVEKGAGEGSGFTDGAYIAAGAAVVDSAADVWAESDMIIKVKEPLESEYLLMHENQIIYTYLHLAAAKSLTFAMLGSKCRGVAYETLREKDGSLPLLAPMSQIAGRLSVIEGAKYMEKPFGGSGLLISGVPGVKNAKVVILGGGVVGTNACKLALGIGADVTVMDVSLARLSLLDDIFGGRVKTVYSTSASIENELSDADLVIGAVLIPGATAPKLIKKSMLPKMQKGSVLVDVAVDQGGCSETTHATTHEAPTYEVDGVLHYCVANMPGAVAHTATKALTNATLKYGLMIADLGLEDAARKDSAVLSAINVYRGACTCQGVSDAFGISCSRAASLM